MLGLGQMGQTSDNLMRTRECVINLPSEDQVTHVDYVAEVAEKWTCMSDAMLQNLRELLPLRY